MNHYTKFVSKHIEWRYWHSTYISPLEDFTAEELEENNDYIDGGK
jgi:hypothetical protein